MSEWLGKAHAHHVACRSMGHAWYARHLSVDRKSGAYERTLECNRCETTRHDYLDRDFHVISRSYGYAHGYRKTKEQKPVARRDATGEMFRRVRVKLPAKRRAA